MQLFHRVKGFPTSILDCLYILNFRFILQVNEMFIFWKVDGCVLQQASLYFSLTCTLWETFSFSLHTSLEKGEQELAQQLQYMHCDIKMCVLVIS